MNSPQVSKFERKWTDAEIQRAVEHDLALMERHWAKVKADKAKGVIQKDRKPKVTDSVMQRHMRKIALIHAKNDGTGPDWVFHQAIRFIYDGYPHHAGPLYQTLRTLEGQSMRLKGLRLILESEAAHPTPLGMLRPMKPGSPAWRRRLLRELKEVPTPKAKG